MCSVIAEPRKQTSPRSASAGKGGVGSVGSAKVSPLGTCLSVTKEVLGHWGFELQSHFKEQASLRIRNPQIMRTATWIKTGDNVEEHENSEPRIAMDAFLF